MNTAKLAAALPAALGKTLGSVFLADHRGDRFQVIFVFTDGTYYELYGTGGLDGARGVDRGNAAEVRRFLALSPAVVTEIIPPAA
jgi:hypothetical protein